MSNYNQLTYEQRCQIEALTKSGFNQQAIAGATGVDQSTISRELNGNTLIQKAGFTRKTAQTGAVTLIQRFGSALNLNVHFHFHFHFHILFLDGI
ncbi:MAG: helix-turn-helix domain-containing protein [Candidatus Thiodiazotropha lotti]|nr:helix-turn-helix domain-containing protein [Candidatus Thiodiazotropha lotti]